jgi:hypothetical protein
VTECLRLRIPTGATLFRAGPATDTLVVSYYPVGGNDRNTGPRYAQEARLTGFDVLGVTRMGTNTCRPSPRLRRQLAPDRFDAWCAEAAPGLAAVCRDYRFVVVRGQSTGAFPALGVVRTWLLPVTHLLLEDGVNTRRTRRGAIRGPVTARLDWLRYLREERAGMRRPPRDGWALPDARTAPRRSTVWFAVEQFHWAPLWRSTWGRDALVQVVRDRPELPVLVKCLGHTALSTPAEVDDLDRALRSARDGGAAPCRLDLDPDAWLAYLVYAEYGAANLRAARELHRPGPPPGPTPGPAATPSAPR